MRLFFAFPLSDSEKRQIGECIASGKECYPGLKWVNPGNIHVTIHFLGDMDSDQTGACIELLDHPSLDFSGFLVGYEGYGRFPAKGAPRVFYLSLTSGIEECCKIHEVLGKLLSPDIMVDGRPFAPHITVARVKKNESVYPDIKKLNCSAGTISVRSVVLYESILQPQGAVYREIARKELKVRSIE